MLPFRAGPGSGKEGSPSLLRSAPVTADIVSVPEVIVMSIQTQEFGLLTAFRPRVGALPLPGRLLMIPKSMSFSPVALPATPVAAFERRLRWPALPALMFLGLMIVLAVVGISASRSRPEPITGLPDDAGLLAARVVVHDRVLPPLGTLRLRSSLLGVGGVPRVFAPVVAENALRAQTLVTGAQHRHARDPRVSAALGSLALVLGRHRAAEAAYRAALDRNGSYGEARLGLGVALARRAWLAPAPLKPRSLELAALAQFMAVPDADPCRLEALYNRAVLLRRVGRNDEARRAARRYLAEDGSSAWAERLRGEMALIASN